MKKNLIYKFRVNAEGTEFHSAMVKSLEDIKSYSYNAENAKSIRGAIKALNEAGERRFANCMTQQVWYADAGKITVEPDEQNFSVTCTSKDALIGSVKIHLGDDAVDLIRGYLN